jgi:restriction system protein
MAPGMLAVSKLSILLVVLMNLAGLHAVDFRVAGLAAAALICLPIARSLGFEPLSDRRSRWLVLLATHREALTKRFRQLVRVNAYGFEEMDKWLDELDRFRASVDLELDRKARRAFERVATAQVRRWAERAADTVFSGDGSRMSPEDYEHHCAELLRRSGWSAEVTGMSGDQGIDVLAERDGLSVAVQCKLLFSRPVGNKAVQEAHAAAGYVETSHAAVVSNAPFTRSAEALAEKLGVLLLHHSELPRLGGLLQRV